MKRQVINQISEFESQELLGYSQKEDIEFEKVLKEYYIVQVLKYFSFETKEIFCLKWWTCISLFYGSGRYSEDIDLDIINSKEQAIIFLENLNNFEWFEMNILKDKAFWFYEFTHNWQQIQVKLDVNLDEKNDFVFKKMQTERIELFTPPISFWCLSPDLLIASKFLAIWERIKWRDFYDLYYLLKNDFKLNTEYFLEKMQKRTNKNFFKWKTGFNEIKAILLEKLKDYKTKIWKNKWVEKEILDDINRFLPRNSKINDILKMYDEIIDLVEKKMIKENLLGNGGFFTENDFKTTNPELQSFLLNWTNRERNSKSKELKNGFILEILPKNNDWFYYQIIDNKGKIVKRFKFKNEVLEYLKI